MTKTIQLENKRLNKQVLQGEVNKKSITKETKNSCTYKLLLQIVANTYKLCNALQDNNQ